MSELQRYQQINLELHDQFEFRSIRQEEAEQAAEIERICFPPHEACSRKMMFERVAAAPEMLLVAVDHVTGNIAGFLSGLSTDEDVFRDEFFVDPGLYHPGGENVMLLGLDVLPDYRGIGLARELVYEYCRRERANNRRKLFLTCLDEKVEMYKRFGFCDNGYANSTWGGEQWHEMYIQL